ncbi:hypothetical protein [Cupriavidus necator]
MTAISGNRDLQQQMRWTDEKAHCMVQVRVAVLNGELSPDRIYALEIAASRHSKCIGPASPNRHRPTNRFNPDILAASQGA